MLVEVGDTCQVVPGARVSNGCFLLLRPQCDALSFSDSC